MLQYPYIRQLQCVLCLKVDITIMYLKSSLNTLHFDNFSTIYRSHKSCVFFKTMEVLKYSLRA